MSDVLVSARITEAKKSAAKDILSSIGATTSDLINTAFDYLLENKELPRTKDAKQPTRADFEQFVAESTLPIEWGPDAPDGDYRELLRQEKRDAYESLA